MSVLPTATESGRTYDLSFDRRYALATATGGTEPMTFAGSGTARWGLTASGAGTMTLTGSGTIAWQLPPVVGVGALTFDGIGTALSSVAPAAIQVPAVDLRFVVLQANGTPIGDLSSARARHLEFNLDGPNTATWTLPGNHPDAKLITELQCDLLVLRDDEALFRGRIATSSDKLSASDYAIQFSAIDYRGMLDRRILWSDSPLSWRQVDQGEIAWGMIADTQNRNGGNWGITRGTGIATGVYRDRDYVPGKKIGEALTQLGDVIDGYDWDIDPELHFNVYYPYRGRPTGIDLVYGAQISEIDRSFVSTNYATAVRYTGSQGLAAAEVEETSFDLKGRWDAQIGNPDLQLEQSVVDAADATLEASAVVTPAYHLYLLEGWWTPQALFLGDSAALFCQSGRLNIQGDTQRVIGMTIDYDDAGGEVVQIDLGDVPPSMSGRLGDYQSRIEVLERSMTGPQGYILDAPVGAMYIWPGSQLPQTWVWADGTAYSKTRYPELFAVIGYTFGGSGDLFAVPDCRARMIVGTSTGGPGLTNRQPGATGGAETVGLSAAQTGSHAHGFGTSYQSADHAHAINLNTGPMSADHTHSGSTGGSSGSHAHQLPVQFYSRTFQGTGPPFTNVEFNTPPGWQGNMSDSMNADHAHGFGTGGSSANHVHNLSGGTGGVNTNHAHTGTTDAGGTAGQAHENMPPFIALGEIIRILPPWRPQP